MLGFRRLSTDDGRERACQHDPLITRIKQPWRKQQNTMTPHDNAKHLFGGTLEKLLGYHLRRAQSAAFQHFASHLKHRDITPGQLGLLVLIAGNPGVSQTALAQEIGVERSTLGEFIDRFESRQIVERRRVATDRRIHAIHLTVKGQQFLEQVLPEVEAHEREFNKPLSAQETRTLVHLLKRLAA